jgi:expansin (peptidoglycan-binding protein)
VSESRSRPLRGLPKGTAMLRPLVAIALLLLAPPARTNEVGCPARIEQTGVTATFYEEIEPNACGLPAAPGALVAAVAEIDWDGSAVCGRCARVSDGLGAEVVVRLTDYCPELGNPLCTPGHLDLSPAAFAVFAPESVGLLEDMRWETVACPVTGNIALWAAPGGSVFYLEIQVRNHRYGVSRLERRNSGSGTWVEMPRASYNRFVATGGQLSFPVSLRATDVHGQVVETLLASLPPLEVEIPTDVQFPVTCPEPAGASIAAIAALGAARRLRPG